MDIANLINHPENLNKETLYDLRSMLALYPYYQPARILLLQNLFLLHDPTFDDELRRAAVYISDRHILFKLVEEAHYQLTPQQRKAEEQATILNNYAVAKQEQDRTTSLIDTFLDQIPEEEELVQETEGKRKPTPADATVDYVAYLLESESKQNEDVTPQLRGQELIDDFIFNEGGKITLQEETEYEPEEHDHNETAENEDTGYFTETLARIYIKQGRYAKALEIIRRLNLVYPKKNRYFASNFSSSNAIMGVRKTTDFVEKTTWGLAIAMVILSVASAYVAPSAPTDESVIENAATQQDNTTNPNNLPNFGASQQKQAAPAAKAPVAPATQTPAAPAK